MRRLRRTGGNADLCFRTQFEEDGCLVIKGFIPQPTTQQLLDRSKELLRDFSLEGHPLTVFSTSAEEKHVGDDYFLNSGDKVTKIQRSLRKRSPVFRLACPSLRRNSRERASRWDLL